MPHVTLSANGRGVIQTQARLMPLLTQVGPGSEPAPRRVSAPLVVQRFTPPKAFSDAPWIAFCRWGSKHGRKALDSAATRPGACGSAASSFATDGSAWGPTKLPFLAR